MRRLPTSSLLALSFAGAFAFAFAFALACTVAPRTAAALPSAVASATAVVLAADTTFKPEGGYTLNMAIEGQPLVMSFTVDKKADGSFVGVFRHAEMGEFTTTSFKVDGRKLTVTVETPGGPATVNLTVAADNAVDGDWTMTGDGSKIAGKKNS